MTIEATLQLRAARADVDDCDEQIAILLARRSRAVARIHQLKLEQDLGRRDSEREQQVIDAVYRWQRTSANGRYSRETIERIYAAIFDGCEQLEAALPRADDVGGRGATRY